MGREHRLRARCPRHARGFRLGSPDVGREGLETRQGSGLETGRQGREQQGADSRMNYDLTVDEFVEAVRPTVERDVDEQIMACDDPVGRRLLMRHRGLIVGKMLDAIRIANLERRLAEAEARLKPRLSRNEEYPAPLPQLH